MAEKKTWEGFCSYFLKTAEGRAAGRKSLRRGWRSLRELAEKCTAQLDEKEIHDLLGKGRDELDPEKNDLKALIAYSVGKGIQDGRALVEALASNHASDPLAFLAEHSGKSFGEKWAPVIARYWLCHPKDRWVKKKAKDFYDVGWFPAELTGREIRIELKASSEDPAFRFQQIRHPRLGGSLSAYDVLLCLGVTAASLEWWAIPASDLETLADNGSNPPESAIITIQHGKRANVWNDTVGYKHEGWFCTDGRSRRILEKYHVLSENLRRRLVN